VRVTRRQFLECAALVSLPRWRIDRLAPEVRSTSGISILDLGNACALRESVSGYKRALGVRVLELELVPTSRPATLIVPAAADLQPRTVQAIFDCLDASGCVILETGLAFAPVRSLDSHRTVLLDVFGIHAGSPVSLWSRARESRIPYVDFTWPHEAKIRDHSLVVPLEARRDEVIASVDGLPVALRGSRSRGTLIFLGSPIGPALWAGDGQAKGWLEAVTNMR
jgi:hypothetical protein